MFKRIKVIKPTQLKSVCILRLFHSLLTEPSRHIYQQRELGSILYLTCRIETEQCKVMTIGPVSILAGYYSIFDRVHEHETGHRRRARH